MTKCKNKGYTVEINISELGYPGYSVECTYYFDKKKDKYSLSMWLTRKDTEMKIAIGTKIDTQYISSEKDNVRNNISLIIEQAAQSGFFDEYIQKYEYMLSCFDRGNTLYEEERLGENNV